MSPFEIDDLFELNIDLFFPVSEIPACSLGPAESPNINHFFLQFVNSSLGMEIAALKSLWMSHSMFMIFSRSFIWAGIMVFKIRGIKIWRTSDCLLGKCI